MRVRRPDLSGPRGAAWNVHECFQSIPDKEATVSAWLVREPHAHPLWHHYLFAVISLADIAGCPPAIKRYPEAEWEFMIAALDPDDHPHPDRRDSWKVLTPLNVVVQFDGCAISRVAFINELAVKAVVQGLLPVEADDYPGATEQWHRSIRASAVCHEPTGG